MKFGQPLTNFEKIKFVDAPPNSLIDSTISPKVKTTKGKGVGVRSLVRNILEVEGCVESLGWGLG